jgi:WD40 repeat protein/tetratricopeptide (TPR) repeat protein
MSSSEPTASLEPTGVLPAEDSTVAPIQTTSTPQAPGGGRYVLHEEIARGGMGVIYRATDTTLDREVAVKVLRERLDASAGAARRFVDEARIAGQLQHPGIPSVHDLGTLPDGRPFLAMKLVKGRTLAVELKERSSPADERGRFLAIFEGICQALGYAHAHNVIHRDLKPANVMVGAFGEVQIMDWGLAKVLASGGRQTAAEETSGATEIRTSRDTDGSETQAGSVLGTPAYMPPEQAIGAIDRIDARSDVFGLGGLLLVILTGRPPFVADSSEATRQLAARAKLEEAFAALDVCGAEPELVALCKRCLSVEQADRPADAGAVAQAVAALRAAAEERARQAELDRVRSEEQRKRRRVQWTLALSVFGLVAVAAFGVALTFFWQSAERAKETAETARDVAKSAREELAIVEYGRTMQVAYQEWRDNNVGATVALLDSIRPELRGWEWHFVYRLCHSDLLTLKGHTDYVTSASFSPDGTRIVTASGDKTARVWDAKSGAEIFTLKGHTGWVHTTSFSPDGTRIVTASEDKTAKVWDAKSGTETLSIKGGAVRSASFSPDGTRIVIASGTSATVWDAQTGTMILTLRGHKATVLSASFSMDGLRIVTASGDGTARVWDAKSGAEILTLRGHKHFVWSASFSMDGLRIVTASGDGTAKVWDAKTGSQTFALKGHTSSVLFASFSPDGTRIVTASYDKTAKVWDAQTGTETLTLKGHSSIVPSASFSPDGTRIVTTSYDKTAKVWDAQTGSDPLTLKAQAGSLLYTPSFSSDGTRIVTASLDPTARVWDAQTGTMILALFGRSNLVFSAAFNPDGTRIITVTNAGVARVWDEQTGAETLLLKLHKGSVHSATFSHDGTRIVTAGQDKTAKVCDAQTGKETVTLQGHTSEVRSASFSPDGTRIVTASDDGTARVWDAKSGTEILSLKGHTSDVRSASFSPDGLRIVTASQDWTARVWDAQTGTEIFTLKGHTGWVHSASFSMDGLRIVTASEDETAKVWDTKSGTETLSIKGHKAAVIGASFSPDGTRIVTASEDGTAKVWDARPMHPDLLPRGLARGDALRARGDLNGALAEYREVLRRTPDDTRTHNSLGLALKETGDLDGAIAAYKEAISRKPDFANAHSNLGMAYQARGDMDGALAAYQEALRLVPKHPGAQTNIPRVKRLQQLLARLPDVLAGKGEPKTPQERCEFANLCGQQYQKRYADAVRLYEKAFAASPGLADSAVAFIRSSGDFHRYDAACCAARAACGEGVGAPTKPQECAVLREKALAWLKADLALWKDKAFEPFDRSLAVRQLTRWLADDGLRETRPGAKREGWTEPESKVWDQLWSEVRETLVEARKP